MKDLKQHTIKREKEIGGNHFYIRPFPAFTAANISGELAGVLAPALAGAVPLLGSSESDVMNLDVSSFGGALSSLNGDKVEKLLNKLLVKHGNITVKLKGESEPVLLDGDLVNEVFCGEAQDMFILAYEVVQANFTGFFEKIGGQFGIRKATPTTAKTELKTLAY
jgi:hypothetical protein